MIGLVVAGRRRIIATDRYRHHRRGETGEERGRGCVANGGEVHQRGMNHHRRQRKSPGVYHLQI